MSGAFQSWDKLIKDWDRESIYANALDGAISNNGELYLLPLAFESTFVVTTKSNMEEFSLTEDDFSNFYKTTDTILYLYEKVPEN